MIRFPAEWEKQAAVLIAWPHHTGDFSNRLDSVEQSYRFIALTIAHHQRLLIVCKDNVHQQHIQQLLDENVSNISFIHADVNDIWVRDTAFLTVENSGQARLCNFRFNGWGEKYPHQNDNALNHKLLQASPFQDIAYMDIDFILEGGSIESDGSDTLMTTGQCLLTASPARPCVPSPCPGRRRSRATGTPGSPGRGRPPPARHAAPSCRRADSPGSKACRRCRPA